MSRRRTNRARTAENSSNPNWRFFLVVATLGLASLALLVRASILQVFSDERLRNLAARQYKKSILLRPRRGEILDRNGVPLAVSEDTYSVAANPRVIRSSDKRRMAQKLSRVLGRF